MAKDAVEYFSEESTVFGYKMHCDFSGESLQVDIIKRILTSRFKPLAPYGGTMVDLGSGFGHEIKFLASEFSLKKVFAIDGSKLMIETMDKDYLCVDISTQVANLLTDKIEVQSGSADIVVSTCTIPYLSEIDNFLSESSRVLKKGRVLAFDVIIHFGNSNEIVTVYSERTEVNSYLYTYENITLLARKHGLTILGEVEMPCRVNDPRAEHIMLFLEKI